MSDYFQQSSSRSNSGDFLRSNQSLDYFYGGNPPTSFCRLFPAPISGPPAAPPLPPLAPPLPDASRSVFLSAGLSGEAPLSDCAHLGGKAAACLTASCRSHFPAAIRIKKPIKTKFRLPVFNWTALKPNQINGTVFNEIDDERVLEVSRICV